MPSKALKFTDLAKVFPVEEAKPTLIPRDSSGSRKPRVLVADDDPVFMLALFQSLAEAGYEVIAMERGTDAVAALRKADHPPVAILDWKLPGMDGMEICERMRDAEKSVYLILTSEQPTSQEIVAGLEIGADLYLPKSIPPRELLAHIKVGERIIQRQHALVQKVKELTGGRLAED